jgi:predicted GNAT superfamily acetyltransferase
MMDLALELGWPVGLLSRVLTERELAKWLAYSQKRKLPQMRIELYLAQLSFLIASAFGGKRDAKLSDYILDFESRPSSATPDDDEDADVEELHAVLQFKPRVKKNGP